MLGRKREKSMDDFMDSYSMAGNAINTAQNTATVLGTYLGEACGCEDGAWVLIGISEKLDEVRNAIDEMRYMFTNEKGGEQ